MVQMDTSV